MANFQSFFLYNVTRESNPGIQLFYGRINKRDKVNLRINDFISWTDALVYRSYRANALQQIN